MSRTQQRERWDPAARVERLEEDADMLEGEIRAVRSLLRSILTTSIATLSSLLVGCILLVLDITLRTR